MLRLEPFNDSPVSRVSHNRFVVNRRWYLHFGEGEKVTSHTKVGRAFLEEFLTKPSSKWANPPVAGGDKMTELFVLLILNLSEKGLDKSNEVYWIYKMLEAVTTVSVELTKVAGVEKVLLKIKCACGLEESTLLGTERYAVLDTLIKNLNQEERSDRVVIQDNTETYCTLAKELASEHKPFPDPVFSQKYGMNARVTMNRGILEVTFVGKRSRFVFHLDEEREGGEILKDILGLFHENFQMAYNDLNSAVPVVHYTDGKITPEMFKDFLGNKKILYIQ